MATGSTADGRERWVGFTLIVLLLHASLALAQSQVQAQFDAAGESRLVALINQARAARGLSSLTMDRRLTEAARQHSVLMAQRGALSHQFPGEPGLADRFSNHNLPADAEGENVDLSQSIDAAHQALMHSPPHRANILNPSYNAVGVGVVGRGPNLYVTEDFAHRIPQYSEPQAESAVQSAISSYARARGHYAPRRKPLTRLRHIACDMALQDRLDLSPAGRTVGAREVFAWTAGDPATLPKSIDRVLSSGLPAGYSLGACFAPSVSHPGGIYWLVLVAY